jgi:hypothetical protein
MKMRQIKLNCLKCYETEDWSSDECRLEVFADGILQVPLKRKLDEGDKWYLNRSYDFRDQIVIKLWDEDPISSDDFLGSAEISSNLLNTTAISFTESGAHYKLWYSVVETPDKDLTEAALIKFEQSSRSGVWRHISKSSLIADIRHKINNPLRIRQRKTQLCGPASIVFELVSRQPLHYVEICQHLYEEGKFQGRTKEVKPSKTLLNSRVYSGVSAADWMLMATLRDTENAIFDVDEDSGKVSMGITTPWEMKGWTFELLGHDQVEFHSTNLYGEFEAMQIAQKAFHIGGVAFLMIDSAMINNDNTIVSWPTHWVAFQGGLDIDEGVWYLHDSGHIKFDCYSWGQIKHVDLDEGSFEDYMWGVVVGY